MPTTRRKNPSSNSRAQPKLAFNARSNKITKPSVAAPSKSLGTEGTAADKLSDATTDDIHVSSVPQIPDDVDLQAEEQNTASELVIRPQVLAESEKRTESEERAARITDAQLKVYWKSKEDERKAPRVHQQGIAMHDKILREFDLSSQYGPCIGIARMKRWKRAEKLGLNPPIEVLAVLLKEDAKNNVKARRAYVDELVSSNFLVD